MQDKRDEPWAITALWISSTTLSADEIGQRMGRANDRQWPQHHRRSRTTWVADLEPADEVPLGDQLGVAERFLADHIGVLEELALVCEITLNLGWHPKISEDGVIVRPSLIALLNRIDASVDLGVYTGPDDINQPDETDEPTG